MRAITIIGLAARPLPQGAAGYGGQAGGGSFGLYAVDSDVTLENVTALAGRGGRGGEAGDGGSGGRGGTGGRGGDGADGQDGGAGAGGIAFGVYAPGASTITQLGSNDFQAVEGGEGGSPSGVRGDSGGLGD